MDQDYLQTKEAKETAKKYADIINRERPVTEESLLKHPRMSLEKRAKIFSPFAALRGYEQKIEKEGIKMLRVAHQEMSDEEREKLSTKLGFVQKGMIVRILYFVPETGREIEPIMGTYQEISGIVQRIDPIEQCICIEKQTIEFQWIQDIVGEMIPDIEDENLQ